jgi:hypothetical protein
VERWCFEKKLSKRYILRFSILEMEKVLASCYSTTQQYRLII